MIDKPIQLPRFHSIPYKLYSSLETTLRELDPNLFDSLLSAFHPVLKPIGINAIRLNPDQTDALLTALNSHNVEVAFFYKILSEFDKWPTIKSLCDLILAKYPGLNTTSTETSACEISEQETKQPKSMIITAQTDKKMQHRKFHSIPYKLYNNLETTFEELDANIFESILLAFSPVLKPIGINAIRLKPNQPEAFLSALNNHNVEVAYFYKILSEFDKWPKIKKLCDLILNEYPELNKTNDGNCQQTSENPSPNDSNIQFVFCYL